MNRNLITRKQFSAAILVSLLSPLLRLLPQTAVRLAGRAAWLSALPAVLALLALAALLGAYRQYMRPGEGMGGLLLRWLGPAAGRVVLVLFAAWFLLYASFILRSGAERLVSTIYPSSGQLLFVLTAIAMCLVISLGSLRAAARTAVILRAVLFGALALVIVFSAPNMEAGQLLPIGFRDTGPVLLGTWPFASVGAVAGAFSFLSGYVERPKDNKWLVSLLLLILGLGGLICAAVVSVFGPALTGEMTYPFFVMIRNISIFDLVPRIEALVVAAWVMADLMLCVMLLRSAHEALRPVFGLPVPDDMPMSSLVHGRFLLWLEAAVILGCSFIFDLPPWELRVWSNVLIPGISNCVLYGGFLLLWLVTAGKRKREPASISNGDAP